VVTAYAAHLEDIQFRKSTSAPREVWALGNSYLERAEPWITVRKDPDQAAFTLRTAINLIRIFAVLAAPMIPTASERILNALGLPPARDGYASQPTLRSRCCSPDMPSPFPTCSSQKYPDWPFFRDVARHGD
jgi:methionyl-tRNA synthetase